MSTTRTARRQPHGHHPRVIQRCPGCWEWACSCGGHADRLTTRRDWRHALIAALLHASTCAGC